MLYWIKLNVYNFKEDRKKMVILITGASSGMGKTTAQELIKSGHKVYCAARSINKMKDLENASGKILEMDVSKEESISAGVETLIRSEGKIDVLWNNAGYGLYGPVEEVGLDKARYQFEVNLFGLAALTQQVLPHMRKQKSGLIINTSSMGGKIYTPLGAWYHATKHALEGWSDCLRLELKEFGINVVVLEPGLIDTGFAAGVDHHFSKESTEGPYKRMVTSLLNATSNGSMKGSSPMVIAKTIKRIIKAKKPKTRYLVGAMAKPLVRIRKIFGDKKYDKIILSQVK
jgi:short-subunit dehydrogenase